MVLLFVQAMCDLALPSYMSDIVNNGIQQGGVVQAAPSAVRQSTLGRVVLFLSAGDRARLLADYSLVNKSSPGAASYLSQYPDLAREPIYVRREVNAGEMAWLDQTMGKGLLATNAFQQATGDPAKAKFSLVASRRARIRPVAAAAGHGRLRAAGQAAGLAASAGRCGRRSAVRRAWQRQDQPVGRRAGQGRVRGARDGQRPNPKPVHPAHRPDYVVDRLAVASLHHHRKPALGAHCCRAGPRSARFVFGKWRASPAANSTSSLRPR